MQCQLNKGIRNLLKSKSQTRIVKVKRQPLGEVNSNLVKLAAADAKIDLNNRSNGQEVSEEAHINILATANNFLDNTSP